MDSSMFFLSLLQRKNFYETSDFFRDGVFSRGGLSVAIEGPLPSESTPWTHVALLATTALALYGFYRLSKANAENKLLKKDIEIKTQTINSQNVEMKNLNETIDLEKNTNTPLKIQIEELKQTLNQKKNINQSLKIQIEESTKTLYQEKNSTRSRGVGGGCC